MVPSELRQYEVNYECINMNYTYTYNYTYMNYTSMNCTKRKLIVNNVIFIPRYLYADPETMTYD